MLPCDLAGAFITMPSSLQNQSLWPRNHYSCTYDIHGRAFSVTTGLRSTGIESGQLWSFYWGAGHEGTSCVLIQLINLFSYITPIDYTHYRFISFQTALCSSPLYQFPSTNFTPITSISIVSYINFHHQLHRFNCIFLITASIPSMHTTNQYVAFSVRRLYVAAATVAHAGWRSTPPCISIQYGHVFAYTASAK